MRKPEIELRNLLEGEQKLGFYTEFFVEAGYLDKPLPVFQSGTLSKVFDLASLTKALVTGPLVHDRLSGKLDSPLGDLLPTILKSKFSIELMKLTPQELLAHRSGLPAWRNLWLDLLDDVLDLRPKLVDPLIPSTFERIKPLVDKADEYSDLGYILLGYTLEAITGTRLSELWGDYLQNLGLQNSSLGFNAQILGKTDEFVPTAFCALRNRLLQGEVHDENCAALGGVSGHAGLFAKGPAIGEYLKALYNSNEGRSYLGRNELERAMHSFEGLSGLRRGNGTSAQLFANGEGMGHLGFVGTAFWLHLTSRRYVVFLTNRVISGRVNPHITKVRREVFGLLNELF